MSGPQWPWLVYSQKQRSVMPTIGTVCAFASRSRRQTTLSGSRAAEPVGSFLIAVDDAEDEIGAEPFFGACGEPVGGDIDGHLEDAGHRGDFVRTPSPSVTKTGTMMSLRRSVTRWSMGRSGSGFSRKRRGRIGNASLIIWIIADDEHNTHLMRNDRRFAAILSTCFLFVLTILMSRHIMWRDEIRTWQVAEHAKNLPDLWNAMRYEGVPVLWYWIVFALTRTGLNPWLMQAVHALMATGVVFVVARWGPFSRITKLLFAFGYFPLFEYGVISRNYSLVFLLVVIACALISSPRINFIALAIVLFLLTQVSIWFGGFGGLLWLTGLMKTRPREAAICGMFVLMGILSCYIECLPGPGESFVGAGSVQLSGAV